MNTPNTTSILNSIAELKNRLSGRKLTPEYYTDVDSGFTGIRILDDGDNTVAVVEPTFVVVEGVAAQTFSPLSIEAEINSILNN